MRREGRQRGMVRTLPVLSAQYNPRPGHRRTLNEIAAPPTAGAFTRAPAKPTNHSKFTGKCALPRCRDCHIHPACKAKDKTKGTHKVRSPLSSEIGDKASGFSATGMVNYFGGDGGEGYESEEDCFDENRRSYDDNTLSFRDIIDNVGCAVVDDTVSFRDIVYTADADADASVDDDDSDILSDDSGKLSFCEVGFVLGSMDGDDEGWCMVEDLS